MASPIYLKSSDSCKFNAELGNARTFAVGKDNGLEFYRKIFGLGPPYSTNTTTPLLFLLVCKKSM